MDLKIDGSTVTTIQFIGTGGNWEYQLIALVSLQAGPQTIRLQSTIANGVDIDAFEISPKINVGQDLVVAPLTTTVYSLSISDNMGCTATDEITLTVTGSCGQNTIFPPPYSYQCGDGKKVDIYGERDSMSA